MTDPFLIFTLTVGGGCALWAIACFARSCWRYYRDHRPNRYRRAA